MTTTQQQTLDGSRLKGSVKISRTVPTGRYQSEKIELGAEFWLDEKSHELMLAELTQKIEKVFDWKK